MKNLTRQTAIRFLLGIRVSFFGRAGAMVACALICLAEPLPAFAPPRDGPPEATVELEVKIVPSRREGYKIWTVELKHSNGVRVAQELGATGDKVRFDDLRPGIYIVCLRGEKLRERCQSVDLVPPPGEKSYKFERDFPAPLPALHRLDTFSVSYVRLAVPDEAREEMKKSQGAQDKGDAKRAMAHLERAVDIYPDYVEALNNLGTYYHRAGKYERAQEYFERATEADPDFYPAWVNLGGSLLAAHRLELALEANERAVEMRPWDALANSQVGLTLFYMRDWKNAKTYFQRVAEIDPYSAKSPHLFLAHIAMAEKKPDEAEHYLRSFLHLHPNSPMAPRLRQTIRNLFSDSASIGAKQNRQP